MFGAILKSTNSSFHKGMTFCRSVYVKKVMKLLAFIFEQPSYIKGRLTDSSRNSLLKLGTTLKWRDLSPSVLGEFFLK